MLKINVNNCTDKRYVYSNRNVSFKGNQTNPQVKQLDNVTTDYNVKTPISYQKTGEIDFPYNTKAYCYKLSNGQKVIVVPQDGETVVRTYVNTGSMNEPDSIRGISHYIEHNLFNGSEGIVNGDFFAQVNKMGASTNASTGFAETNYYISSNLLNEGDLENKIRLHASMIQSPLFAMDKLEKEKGVVNSEINMITSDPANIAVNTMLKNLYGIKSSSSDLIGGTTHNISNLTRDDVVNYFNNNYYPANMVTVVCGEVNPDDTIKLISKYFTNNKLPSGKRHFEPLIPIDKTVREDIISDKAVGTDIIVGFNGPSTANYKDKIYMNALLALLSMPSISRINSKLKDLNTDVYSDFEKISSNPRDGKAIIFECTSTDENSEKALKIIFNEIGNVCNNPPTDKEMKIIKKMMLKSYAKVFDNSFSTNDAIGTSFLENNSDYLINYKKIVEDMTPADIVSCSKKYLDTNKASVCIVHPSTSTKESINNNYKNISFTGKDAINFSKIKEYNMSNNYKLLTVDSKTDNVEIALKIDKNNYETTKPSAYLVLSELLNEGSIFKNRVDFESNLAEEGIITAFAAKNNLVNCLANCDSSNIDLAFKAIKEVIDNPRFTEEDFEKAKNLVKDNIKISDKSAIDKLDSELFKGLPQGISKDEMLSNLDNLTLEDVKNLYKMIMSNGQGTIAVSAPFSTDSELKNKVFNSVFTLNSVKEFYPVELHNLYKPVESVKVLQDTDNKNQAEIIESFKFRQNSNLKDDVTVELLNIILGASPSSRLFMDLREKEKLAYQVKSTYRTVDDIGVLSLKIKTTTDNADTGEKSFDNVKRSIDGFNKHINKLKTEKVTDEELENAKLSLKNLVLNSNHDDLDKNINLTKDLDSPYGLTKVNQYMDMIDKISADDIYNAANYIFESKPVYSILATKNTLDANKEFLSDLS